MKFSEALTILSKAVLHVSNEEVEPWVDGDLLVVQTLSPAETEKFLKELTVEKLRQLASAFNKDRSRKNYKVPEDGSKDQIIRALLAGKNPILFPRLETLAAKNFIRALPFRQAPSVKPFMVVLRSIDLASQDALAEAEDLPDTQILPPEPVTLSEEEEESKEEESESTSPDQAETRLRRSLQREQTLIEMMQKLTSPAATQARERPPPEKATPPQTEEQMAQRPAARSPRRQTEARQAPPAVHAVDLTDPEADQEVAPTPTFRRTGANALARIGIPMSFTGPDPGARTKCRYKTAVAGLAKAVEACDDALEEDSQFLSPLEETVILLFVLVADFISASVDSATFQGDVASLAMEAGPLRSHCETITMSLLEKREMDFCAQTPLWQDTVSAFDALFMTARTMIHNRAKLLAANTKATGKAPPGPTTAATPTATKKSARSQRKRTARANPAATATPATVVQTQQPYSFPTFQQQAQFHGYQQPAPPVPGAYYSTSPMAATPYAAPSPYYYPGRDEKSYSSTASTPFRGQPRGRGSSKRY